MRSVLILAFALASCGGGSDHNNSPRPQPTSQWTIGPIIDGKQYSTGYAAGDTITVHDVHYVTKPSGPLTGTISMTFHIDAPLTGTGCAAPATATLYFQRKGDDWSMDRGYRWWATFATVTLDHAGDYSMSAPLDGHWTSDEHKTWANAAGDFAEAKAKADKVGFTLGNCTGYGHGATGPATLTILGYSVH